MEPIEPQPIPEPLFKRNSYSNLRDSFRRVGIDVTKRAIQSDNFVTGSAGWRLTAEGDFEGSSGTFRGTITASAGTIGGWTIVAGRISAGSGAATVGLDSTVTGGDDIRIFAGSATMSSAPFRVTEAGVLTATSATITGTIQTATSGQRIVISSSDNTLRFNNGTTEIINIGTDTTTAIKLVMDSTVINGLLVTGSTSTVALNYSNSGNVNNRAILISMTGTSGNTLSPIDITNTGTNYGINLIVSSGGMQVSNSGGVGLNIINTSGADSINISNSGAGGNNGYCIEMSMNNANNTKGALYATSNNSTQTIGTVLFSRSSAGVIQDLTMSINSSSRAIGMVFNIANAGAGGSYAFDFEGSEYASSAVGGTQDRKIRVLIGGTNYFIPAYTA